MLRKYTLPTIALLGAIIALFVVFWSEKKVEVPFIPFPPASSPYTYSIAGEGIVEASSRNISIGSPFSEIITKIYVIEGDCVEEGDPLFTLDTRLLIAQKETSERQIELMQVKVENQRTQFSFYANLTDKNAVSQQEYEKAYFALKESEESLQVAIARLKEIETNIARSTIQASVSGEILQVNVHIGEIAPVVPPVAPQTIVPYGSSQYPLMLIGTMDPLHIRIDIDEEDAWRYEKGKRATAFVRGNSNIFFPLTFVRIEPYIIPKASFNGDTTQRIDTRVLQVLYAFEDPHPSVYAGQMLDIFIESAPLPLEKEN